LLLLESKVERRTKNRILFLRTKARRRAPEVSLNRWEVSSNRSWKTERPVNLVVVIVGFASMWEVLWKFWLEYYSTLQVRFD